LCSETLKQCLVLPGESEGSVMCCCSASRGLSCNYVMI